ncbi:unnamed protein product [Prorocentrum cordatum]|uniref:RNA-directed RNA polymerase n=1 Tax=Prorocentrum cordatum TaxID=2364126 RepID=A0ABN9UPK0_9DINO|nr:unnamed protein product [Polarella glacialis]
MAQGGLLDADESITRFAKASHSLNRDEITQVQTVCEVAKEVCRRAVAAVVRDAEHGACLQSCSSDGTPIQVSQRVSARLPSGKVVKRFGRSSHEFLVGVQLVRHVAPSGELRTAAQIRDPVPLTHGKTAPRQFEAGRSQWPTLRQLGHRGAVVQHYVWDRAGITAMSRLTHQYHELLAPQFSTSLRSHHTLRLLEFVVITACSAHDCQNAFKWSLPDNFGDPDVLRDVYIGIASVRNTFDDVLKYVHEWAATSMQFSTPLGGAEKRRWRAVWGALMLDEEVVHVLTDVLECRFVDGQLWLSENAGERVDCVGLTCTTLLAVWRFRRFSDSRWLTVGASARTMVAAHLAGICGLFEWIRQKSPKGGYYRNGFWRLKPDRWAFLVRAALVATVPDAAMSLLLKDGRVALRLDELKANTRSAMEELSCVAPDAWLTFGSVCQAPGPQLREQCLRGGHRARAFLQFRVFDVAEALPFSLCRGGVPANLEALAAGARPEERVSGQLYDLMAMGHNRLELVEVVRLIGDVPWASQIAEQLHASAALLSRWHPECELQTLLARSMVHAAAKLLPRPTDLDKEAFELETKIAKLRKKCPEKAGGRQMYVRDLSTLLKDKERRPRPLRGKLRAVFKQHGPRYAKLSSAVKKRYQKQARGHAAQRRGELARQIGTLLESLYAVRDKIQQEAARRPPMSLSAAKWTGQDTDEFRALGSAPEFYKGLLDQKRRAACEAPAPMSESLAKALAEQEVEQGAAEQLPDWAGQVAAHREYFEVAVFTWRVGGEEQAWMFVFAMQQPVHVSVSRCHRVEEEYDAADFACPASPWAPRWHPHVFDVDYTVNKSCGFMAAVPVGDISVVPDFRCVGSRRWASDVPAVPLRAFLARLPPVCRRVPGPVPHDEHAAGMRPSLGPKDAPWAQDGLERLRLARKGAAVDGSADSDPDPDEASDADDGSEADDDHVDNLRPAVEAAAAIETVVESSDIGKELFGDKVVEVLSAKVAEVFAVHVGRFGQAEMTSDSLELHKEKALEAVQELPSIAVLPNRRKITFSFIGQEIPDSVSSLSEEADRRFSAFWKAAAVKQEKLTKLWCEDPVGVCSSGVPRGGRRGGGDVREGRGGEGGVRRLLQRGRQKHGRRGPGRAQGEEGVVADL